MESTIYFRVISALLIIVGLVLVVHPELVSNRPVPQDTFEAVERRIWWGLIIGAGILLGFHHQLFPLNLSFAAAAVSLMTGLLIARLIGIAIDGSVVKQWLNVGIELVLLLPLFWWYFKASA